MEKYEEIEYIRMDKDPVTFERAPKNIVLVSSFLDIGRGEWKEYSRDPRVYIESFLKYLDYEYEMIVFVDERYYQEITRSYNKSIHKNKIIIPINEEWCKKNLESWKSLERYREIMSSEYYRKIVDQRINLGYPENTSPEYNIINHSKIDFINYCIDKNLSSSDFFCWTDFGYFSAILKNEKENYPKSILNPSLINYDKITFFLRNKIAEQDENPIYTLINSPEKFTGSFWCGNSKNLKILHNLYHSSLREMIDKNIADDDQHLYLRCFLKNPEIFQLYLSEKEWPRALKYLQKNKKMSKKFFDCGTHLFQGFQHFSELYSIDNTWECYCFEANPITYKFSEKIRNELLEKGYNISHFNSAVSNKEEMLKINCAQDGESFTNQGSNILREPPERDIVYGGHFNYDKEEIQVKGINFADFLKNNTDPEDFVIIKMDIEGAEFDVLDSLIDSGVFKNINKIYVEFHERFFSNQEIYSDKKAKYMEIFKEANVELNEWV
jgi:protein YibB